MGKWAKIKNYFMNISLLSYIYKGKVFSLNDFTNKITDFSRVIIKGKT